MPFIYMWGTRVAAGRGSRKIGRNLSETFQVVIRPKTEIKLVSLRYLLGDICACYTPFDDSFDRKNANDEPIMPTESAI